ncbi:hypothetical protein DDB_G0281817 [Dictyostelium discoideum AX4]|uniref:Uncharacterized protein n=1 Tax=Dictyostelium discoideum TaxID=44689 RepID=Q54TF4_DICDI|nr:hypothetical protein DDB_G0281817 [Dictyostelium discoideum AX4]EAL66670.1 hypothetical protein DDB_G0281817 [Dictyostelium discoideum AX4]|eukprot:XP_640637.1 hypothetical protein DDB_G0281817 [Dictyostelium discoideum AX4]
MFKKKTIGYSIQQIKSYEYNQYSIEILLDSGNYYSQNPINLYGLNISISAQNSNDLVQFLVPNINGTVSPIFIVEYPYKATSIVPTNIMIRYVTISGCNSLNVSESGCFFQGYIGVNAFLNVDIENVNFLCESLYSPYFSLSGNSRISSESNDLKNHGIKKPLSMDSSKLLKNDESSQDLEMKMVTQYFFGEQYPNDNINISFILNNCNFGSNNITNVNNNVPFVLNYDFGPIIDLTISNTIFNSFLIYRGSSIASITAGSFTMNNVSIINTKYYGSIYSFFLRFSNCRVSLNQVSISGEFDGSRSLIYSVNSLLNANQFNVELNYSSGVIMDVITLISTFAYFENSTIDLYVSSDFNTKEGNLHGNVGLFSPQMSNIYLFSNRIFSNGTSIINSLLSDVIANNNQFVFAPSSTNDFQLIVCDEANTNFYGDSSFTDLAESCQTPSDTAKQWNELRENLLSYFCGVLSMFLIFLTAFIISWIFNCRKMKKLNRINKSLKLLP